MPTIDDLANLGLITVEGPGWSARLALDKESVGLGGKTRNAIAARMLAVDDIDNQLAASSADLTLKSIHFPSLLHVSGKIESVTIPPGSQNKFTNDGSWEPARLTIRYAPGGGQPLRFVCESGEVGLTGLGANAIATNLFGELLPLSKNQAPANIWINSAGFRLVGPLTLPWHNDSDVPPIGTAVTLVAGSGNAPDDPENPGTPVPSVNGWFTMRLDPDASSEDARTYFTKALSSLSGVLAAGKPGDSPARANLSLNSLTPNLAEILAWPVGTTATGFFRRWGFANLASGSLTLELTDQYPVTDKSGKRLPAETKATTVPATIIIEGHELSPPATSLTIKFADLSKLAAATPLNAISYLAARAADNAADIVETITIGSSATPVHLGFDPVAIPTQLRPLIGEDPAALSQSSARLSLDVPLLWVFTPLADGWAQIPILNLSREVYYAAKNTSDKSVPPQPASIGRVPGGLFKGAVSIGNSRSELLVDSSSGSGADPSRHPWELSLEDAGSYTAVWTLTRPDGNASFAFSSAKIDFQDPQFDLLGLLWIATKRPSPADALPDHEFWSSSLINVPLSTPRAPVEYDPIFGVWLENFKITTRNGPATTQCNPSIGKDAVFGFEYNDEQWQWISAALSIPAFGGKNVLSPLAWRRDPRSPFVTNMPLLQTLNPPVYPSASRQLMPRALEMVPQLSGGSQFASFNGLKFAIAENASDWPSLSSTATSSIPVEITGDDPSKIWDLTTVSLVLPGLVQDPTLGTDLVAASIPGIYCRTLRHDLPYCDEQHALAQLPKTPPASPDLADPTPAPPPAALHRDTMGDYFRQMNDLAALAAADNAEMISRATKNVTGLYSSLEWGAKATLIDPQESPSLSFTLNNTKLPVFNGQTSAKGESGLIGITASFEVDTNSLALDLESSGSVRIVAGSMSARPSGKGDSIDDQRGLARGATQPATGNPAQLETPVRTMFDPKTGTPIPLQLDTGTGQIKSIPYTLASTQAPIPLKVSGDTWKFRFRDLPLSNGAFSRKDIGYKEYNCNDSDAISPARDFLRSYEWRLSLDGHDLREGEPDWLPFLGLHLLPLQLVTFDKTGTAILARLQLPVPINLASEQTTDNFLRVIEQDQLSNLVVLHFGADGTLQTNIELIKDTAKDPVEIQWPLQLAGADPGMSPRLCFSFVESAGGFLRIKGAHLTFQILGVQWDIPVTGKNSAGVALPDGVVELNGASGPIILTAEDQKVPADVQLWGKQLKVTLNLPKFIAGADEPMAHEALLTLGFDLQKLSGDLPVNLLSDNLLSDKLSGPSATLFDAALSGVVASLKPEVSFNLTWSGFSGDPATIEQIQILPGIHPAAIAGDQSSSACKGAAACQYVQTTSGSTFRFCQFKMTAAYVEAVIHCASDGLSLFDKGDDVSAKSAGVVDIPEAAVLAPTWYALDVGYVAVGGNAWESKLLLNGILEINDLISWPESWMTDPGTTNQVVVPQVKHGDRLFPHVRHSIRCCFNQHDLTGLVALQATSTPAVFDIDLTKTGSITLLCAVEHQYLALTQTDPDKFNATKVLRWTALQEVRFMSISQLSDDIKDIRDWKSISPMTGAYGSLTRLCTGYFGEALSDGILGRLSDIANGKSTGLIVEAGAAFWLHSVPAGQVPAFGDLLAMQAGELQAAANDPDIFSAAGDNLWTLFQAPFLGRMGDESFWPDPLEELPGFDPTDPSSLLMQRCLAHRSEGANPVVAIASEDQASARTARGLDDRMIVAPQRENPIRIAPEEVPSVLAAVPNALASAGTEDAISIAFGAPETTSEGLRWRYSSVLTNQTCVVNGEGNLPAHGWIAEGAALLKSGLWSNGLAYACAATVVYAGQSPPGGYRSIVTSPYLALNLAKVTKATADACSAARYELIAAGTPGQGAVEIQLSGVFTSQLADAAAWGEAYYQYSTQAGIGIVREAVLKTRAATGGGQLYMEYRFIRLKLPEALRPQPLFPLRASPSLLAFREVHFGGVISLKRELENIELAPPLITQAWPLQVDNPSGGGTGGWPYGFSAYVTEAATAKAGVSLAGDRPSSEGIFSTLWWRSVQQQVQYRNSFDLARAASALPDDFAASPVEALSPLLPTAEPPQLFAEADSPTKLIDHCQPVLPGSITTLLVNCRAGVYYSLRHTLQVQQLAEEGAAPSLVSTSVPFQARFPRPIALPPNIRKKELQALQPWSSYFEPTRNPGDFASVSPWDEVSIISDPDKSSRLVISLDKPASGLIDDDWDGVISFRGEGISATDNGGTWLCYMRIVSSEGAVLWPLPPGQGSATPPQQSFAPIAFFSRAKNALTSNPIVVAQQDRQQLLATLRQASAQGDSSFISILAFPVGSNANPADVSDNDILDSSKVPDEVKQILGPPTQGKTLSQFINEALKSLDVQAKAQTLAGTTGVSTQTQDFVNRASADPATFQGWAARMLLQDACRTGSNKPQDLLWLQEDKYHQEIRMRLEIGSSGLLPMPLRPYFIRFEDPAYNVRLQSPTESCSQPVPSPSTQKLTFSVDRQQYNPDSPLYYTLVPEVAPDRTELVLSVLHADGTTQQIDSPPKAGASCKDNSGTIYSIQLGSLTIGGANAPALSPGDMLTVTMNCYFKKQNNPADDTLVALGLDVRIVGNPVNPPPDSAFGLLARNQNGSGQPYEECPRFAWTPTPDRIELVNPDDLQTGFVRRRAVYTWSDVTRLRLDSKQALLSPDYFVQKIASNGSTHFRS